MGAGHRVRDAGRDRVLSRHARASRLRDRGRGHHRVVLPGRHAARLGPCSGMRRRPAHAADRLRYPVWRSCSTPVSWEALAAARTRRGGGRRHCLGAGLFGVRDVISFAGGFPDPETFPRERVASLLAEFAGTARASAFQYTPTRGLAGTLDALADPSRADAGRSARRRAADHERRDRGARARSGRRSSIRATWSSSKARHTSARSVVPELRAELVAGHAGRGRSQVDELDQPLAAGLRPKLLYTIPDHQNPAGVSLSADRRAALGRARAPYGFLVVEDVAYRELGFADEACASLWSLAPDVVVQAGRRRRRSSPASASVGLQGRQRSSTGSCRRSRSRTSARARSGSGSSRSPSGAAGSTSSSCVHGRSTRASASACWPRSSASMPESRAGRRRTAASSRG